MKTVDETCITSLRPQQKLNNTQTLLSSGRQQSNTPNYEKRHDCISDTQASMIDLTGEEMIHI